MSSLEIQHQTRAVFHCWGDKGLLEGIGGLPRVCGGSQQSHIYLLSIAFVNMDPPVHLTSLLCQAYLGESMLFVPYFYHGLRGDRSFKVWFGADSKNECESDQPMRAQLSFTPIAVRGSSSSFIPIWGLRERATCLPGWCGEVVFTTYNKRILRFCLTFSGVDHKLRSTVLLKMSKNSVKTILITLYLSAVQDPEPLL